ncbi:MAG: hypothetical protein J6P65_01925 [Bacteroidales bacterium]|nr:hypothetical protein [Bacteroidales bacterium]
MHFVNSWKVYFDAELFADFLTHREVTWLGVDFSKAKFTRSGFQLPQEVLLRYLNDWNMLIISDQKKYDVRMSFRKPIMQYDLSWVTKRNKTLKINNMLSEFITIDAVYSDEAVIDYIQKSNFPKTTPYALLFMVESFDEHTKLGTVWVVLIHAEDHKVVLCEKFMKSPSGFGLRNYWGRVFYNLFFDIQKYAFPRWENLVKVES